MCLTAQLLNKLLRFFGPENVQSEVLLTIRPLNVIIKIPNPHISDTLKWIVSIVIQVNDLFDDDSLGFR